MSYYGSNPEDNDFASGSVGAIVYLIMKNMRRDIESVAKAGHPEHSIAAHAKLLRIIEQHFPNVVRPHVGKTEIEEMRQELEAWFEKAHAKLPRSEAAAIRESWPKEIDTLASVLGIQET